MEHIIMNRKEREQLIIFRKLKNKEISQVEAALQLKISTRWIRKKYKRYEELGDIGIIHKNRGTISKRQWNEKDKKIAIELLQSDWKDFGPSFAAEKLEELKQIKVSKETVRKSMIKAGIWQSKTRKLKHRKRRERRDRKGEMIQLDGSYHDWFEGRNLWCTLLVFIDDATSEILWLEFATRESYDGVMKATKNYINTHGRPHEFYVDFGSVFSVNLNNPERDKKTHWEIALQELDITVNHAHSPQAKGRVERVNKTLQDRLIKEMRLAGISSIESANNFLCNSNFIAHHNQKFAIRPTKSGNAHRSIATYNLSDIFVIRDERVLANDYTIVYNKRIFQVQDQRKAIVRPKDTITINLQLDGTIRLSIRKIFLDFVEISERNKPKPKQSKTKMSSYKPQRPSVNSKRWAFGLPPLSIKNFNEESRVKTALPAAEVILNK